MDQVLGWLVPLVALASGVAFVTFGSLLCLLCAIALLPFAVIRLHAATAG